MREAILQSGSVLRRAFTAVTGSGAAIVVTPPSWRLRFGRWLTALLICLLLYQSYVFVIVPWVEPALPHKRNERLQDSWVHNATNSDVELQELFGPEAWERNNPMELKTRWGRLLFQEYVRIDKGIELHPCTMLFYAPTTQPDGTRAKRTIVLKTQDKAVLSFSGNLNLVQPQVGKLEGALLDGEVRIYSRETSQGANDALNIVTRKIQIRPTQIWTPHDVAFQYGSSRGSGRLLTITIGPNKNDAEDDTNQILMRSIEMLELVHVDRLHLDFPRSDARLFDTGPAQSESPAAKHTAPAASASPSTTLDVTCRGSFLFNFQESVATLQDHVDVVHPSPAGENDHLHCDRLEVHFSSAAPQTQSTATDEADGQSAKPAGGGSAEEKRLLPKMTIRRIRATGNEVTLQAPSLQTAARGQLLQYDFHTRRMLLEDPQEAMLAYGEHVVTTPRLEYELREEPQRLGRLWATGPGVYEGVIDDKNQSLEVRWQGTLQLQPQDDLHVLSVAEGANIQWGSTGRFSADKLFIWLAEVAAAERTDATANKPSATIVDTSREMSRPGPELNGPVVGPPNMVSAGSVSQEDKLEIRPVKMLAQGNVQAESAQFQGETAQLEIWFEYPAPSSPEQEGKGAAEKDTVPGQTTDTAPEPDTDASNSNKNGAVFSGTTTAGKPVKQFQLSGTQVRLRLRMAEPRPAVREATVLGQVRLAQRANLPNGPPPLLVTGDMLQLQNDELERATIDVRGDQTRLARVQIRGLMLEGSNLHLSQRENLLWLEGPGRTRLPARSHNGTPTTEARREENRSLSFTAPIWISWQGGMDFDGQLIRFMEHVEVSGVHGSDDGDQYYLRSIGDQLHATLNRYVDFANTKRTDDLDVVELRFLGEVVTDNQTFNPQNTLTSRDRMNARDLTLDRRTGKFTGRGPGWITTTRIDSEKASADRAGAAPVSNGGPRNTTSGSTQQLVYLRIDFQNAVQGNLELREGEFIHFVRAVYGPVTSWDQTLNPNRRGGLGPDGVTLTCNKLKVAEMKYGRERAIEMSALGNTIVEGERFRANAERLTYVEAKEQLIFEGTRRNLATLQRRVRLGAKPDEFIARKIVYGIKSGMVDVSGAASLNYNQLGTPGNIPSARIR